MERKNGGNTKVELWYKLSRIPDLTLNKYGSLGESGVNGVLEKHVAFLRQLNRKGIVSGLSFHLFYLYLRPEEEDKDTPGRRLQIFFLIRGEESAMRNAGAMVESSFLSRFFEFERGEDKELSIANVMGERGMEVPKFDTCCVLTKAETFLPAELSQGEPYYLLREWEMNEEGRLYNLCTIMEEVDRTVLYRVDLYPVEYSMALRDDLRNPMDILRRRQDNHGLNGRRDYEGRDALDSYERMIEIYDSSPHFIVNIMAFANDRDDAATIVDAAGAESLLKGKYSVATFRSSFSPASFLDGERMELADRRSGMVLRSGNPGLIVCSEAMAGERLKKLYYFPTLFTLKEVAPFFRFPALYDGEVVQIPKETAPVLIDRKEALFLGKDTNGYDVYFPLKLFPKHAFIAGVPGSGKTNTMHHITSSLKNAGIPFLVLEPAKKEYRALLNDPRMRGIYLFSPNADMSFPLHINPFEMPEGMLVAEHIRSLCSVFEGAFPMQPPMPYLLDTAIEAVYRDCGWRPDDAFYDLVKEEKPSGRSIPTLAMLYRRMERELEETKYSEENRGNLESALKVRIGSLLRREMGDVFDVPYSTFPPEKWLDVSAIIELESMGSGPANFLTLMLCSLIRETLKMQPVYTGGDVRHVIFIEEAHNLIGPQSEEKTGEDADPKQAATAFIVKMLAEVRALKEGIVIADQLPSVMAQEVLKNTGLKLGLKITASDDREILGNTMAATPLQTEEMAVFDVGEALIFYEKLQRPFRMRVQKWWADCEDASLKESRNDEELRNVLKDDPACLEINRISMKIVLNKNVLLLTKLLEEMKSLTEAYCRDGEEANRLQEEIRVLQEKAVEMEMQINGLPRGGNGLAEKEQELLEERAQKGELLARLSMDSCRDQKAVTLTREALERVFLLYKTVYKKRHSAPLLSIQEMYHMMSYVGGGIQQLREAMEDLKGTTEASECVSGYMYKLWEKFRDVEAYLGRQL